ncbi:MAG: hypothetical protein ABFD89_12605 [Bryobacteraceae bacterium]
MINTSEERVWQVATGDHKGYRVIRYRDGTQEQLCGPSGRTRYFKTYRGAACAATEQNWKEPPAVPTPDPYKKTDMTHAVEGYCPHCGSNESIDILNREEHRGEKIPLADWYGTEYLHCNKCGRDFEQLYAATFDGQKHTYHRLNPDDKLRNAAERLARTLGDFIESAELAANPEDGVLDSPEWCEGYRTEFGMRRELVESPAFKRLKERLEQLQQSLD